MITNLLAPAAELITRLSALTRTVNAVEVPAFKRVLFAASLDENYLLSFAAPLPCCFLYYSVSTPDPDIKEVVFIQDWDIIVLTRNFIDIDSKQNAFNEAGELLAIVLNNLTNNPLRIKGFGDIKVSPTPLLPSATADSDGIAFNFLRVSNHVEWVSDI